MTWKSFVMLLILTLTAKFHTIISCLIIYLPKYIKCSILNILPLRQNFRNSFIKLISLYQYFLSFQMYHLFIIIIIIIIIIVLGRSTLQYLQSFLQYIKYVILEFTPSTALLRSPLPQFLEQFQQISFFYLHHLRSTLFF
jgi:hypothetical protein